MTTIRLAIAGVGNCASSLIQGVEYYRDADPADDGPRPHARRAGRLPRRRRRVRGRLRRRRRQGRPRPGQGHLRRPEQHHPLRPGRRARRAGPAGPDLRRASASTTARRSRSRRPSRSTWPQVLRDSQGRRAGLLPAGRLRGRPRSTTPRPASTPRWRFVNAIPVFIASDPEWAAEVRRRRRADRRRRHQEPGRRHHRAPHPGPPVRGPGPGARPHLPAQRRRQHGLQEHARARAARVQEDLQDPGRDQPDRQRDRRPRRAHRAVRPRALARRPQVGLHPPRRPQLRRRAPQRRAQARGVGLAQLGRRHHRRPALRQAGHGPRHRRPAAGPVRLLHEVARRCSTTTTWLTRWSRSSPPARPDRPRRWWPRCHPGGTSDPEAAHITHRPGGSRQTRGHV